MLQGCSQPLAKPKPKRLSVDIERWILETATLPPEASEEKTAEGTREQTLVAWTGRPTKTSEPLEKLAHKRVMNKAPPRLAVLTKPWQQKTDFVLYSHSKCNDIAPKKNFFESKKRIFVESWKTIIFGGDRYLDWCSTGKPQKRKHAREGERSKMLEHSAKLKGTAQKEFFCSPERIFLRPPERIFLSKKKDFFWVATLPGRGGAPLGTSKH